VWGWNPSQGRTKTSAGKSGTPSVAFQATARSELSSVSLPVVEYDGTLPPACLVVVQLSEMGDDPQSGSGLGAHTPDQRVVGVRLAGPGAVVAPVKHDGLRRPDRMTRSDHGIKIQILN
jgi:hypothetical protein